MKRKSLLPVDIPLMENVDLGDGAIFIRLRTLAELQNFWSARSVAYSFAAKGIAYGSSQLFLNEFEWVFAPTKSSLVRAFTRWDDIGIRCKWYDWPNDKDASVSHEQWFKERDALRLDYMEKGRWTSDDEAGYQRDLLIRTPDSYRGWWTLQNLPWNMSWYDDWFDPATDVEIIDPTIPHRSGRPADARTDF